MLGSCRGGDGVPLFFGGCWKASLSLSRRGGKREACMGAKSGEVTLDRYGG